MTGFYHLPRNSSPSALEDVLIDTFRAQGQRPSVAAATGGSHSAEELSQGAGTLHLPSGQQVHLQPCCHGNGKGLSAKKREGPNWENWQSRSLMILSADMIPSLAII